MKKMTFYYLDRRYIRVDFEYRLVFILDEKNNEKKFRKEKKKKLISYLYNEQFQSHCPQMELNMCEWTYGLTTKQNI